MAIEFLLWDNDGVLVDSEQLYYQASAEILATLGVELDHARFAELSLHSAQGVFQLAPSEDEAALRERRNARYDELLAAAEDLVIDGVREVVSALAGSYRMAIASSSRPEHFHTIHARTGLLEHFEFALVKGDYARAKPHPDPWQAAMARFGARPEQCLVIEDSPRGLQAAVAAEIRCVVVPSPFVGQHDWPGAHAVMTSIAELPALLDALKQTQD